MEKAVKGEVEEAAEELVEEEVEEEVELRIVVASEPRETSLKLI